MDFLSGRNPNKTLVLYNKRAYLCLNIMNLEQKNQLKNNLMVTWFFFFGLLIFYSGP